MALKMLDALAVDFDLTATLAARITQRLLGRAISRPVLLDRYGTKGRTASNKSEDFSALDNKIISHQNFSDAKKELEELLAAAAAARAARVKAASSKQTIAQRMLSASAKRPYNT